MFSSCVFLCFFFNDTATTEIYTLSLHDALPISRRPAPRHRSRSLNPSSKPPSRSEEHTSELQSRRDLVCRLLLEQKKKENKLEPAGLQTQVNENRTQLAAKA